MQSKMTLSRFLVIAEIVVLILVFVLGAIHSIGRKDNTTTSESTGEVPNNQIGSTESGTATSYHETAETFSDEVEAKLDEMTTEEMVAQLFLVKPEAIVEADTVTITGNGMRDALNQYPVAGLVYSEKNFMGKEQTSEMLQRADELSQDRISLPLLFAVEEEGGEVYSPLALKNDYAIQPLASEHIQIEGTDSVAKSAETRAKYLTEQGFNMTLSPMADCATGLNAELDARTFGNSPIEVAVYVATDIRNLQSNGVISVAKYFPGYTNATVSDSLNVKVIEKTLQELEENEFIVYQEAINAGVSCIMVGNVTAHAITKDAGVFCTMSEHTTIYLRNTMGYTGVLVTDDLAHPQVSQYFTTGASSVVAINAGMDMIYLSDGFAEAYQSVLNAVETNQISQIRLRNAAGRILTLKESMK